MKGVNTESGRRFSARKSPSDFFILHRRSVRFARRLPSIVHGVVRGTKLHRRPLEKSSGKSLETVRNDPDIRRSTPRNGKPVFFFFAGGGGGGASVSPRTTLESGDFHSNRKSLALKSITSASTLGAVVDSFFFHPTDPVDVDVDVP